MKKSKPEGMYITVGRHELLIHVPLNIIVEEILPRKTESGSLQLTGFTLRQRQVLDGLLRCRSNKEIAAEMGLAERTVKFHVSNVLLKTHTKTRNELQRRYGKLEGEDQ